MSLVGSGIHQFPLDLSYDNERFDISDIGTENKACSLCTTVEEHLRHILPKIPKMPITREQVENNRVYKVDVYTGHEVGSGTNANVYITIQGSEGILKRTKLSHAKTSTIFYFMRATKEVFFLKGPNIGNLETVLIEHDGLEERHSWLLDKIDITDPWTDHCWTFPCGQWLSRHMTDCSSKKRLVGRTVELNSNVAQDLPQTDYTISVTLGKKTPGSTGASFVVLTLFGTEGHSTAIDLTNDALWETKKFDGGQTITMATDLKNIGELTKVRIEHDSADYTQGWFLVRVVVKCTNSKKYYFQYSGWIGKDTKGKVIRDIKCHKALPNQVTQEKSDWRFCYLCANMEEHKRNHLHWRPKRPFTAKPTLEYKPNKLKIKQREETEETQRRRSEENMYKVDIYTGDTGTKANVYVTVMGQEGMIKRTRLQQGKGSSDFSKFSTQTFLISGPYLGNLLLLSIEHDGEERRDSWFLDKVTLTDTHTNRMWSFPCHQWLSLYKQDGRLRRDLVGKETTKQVAGSIPQRNEKKVLTMNTEVKPRVSRSSSAEVTQTSTRPKTSVGRTNHSVRNVPPLSHSLTAEDNRVKSVKGAETLEQTTNTDILRTESATPAASDATTRQQRARPMLQPLRQQLEEPLLKPTSQNTSEDVNPRNYSVIKPQTNTYQHQLDGHFNKAVPVLTNKAHGGSFINSQQSWNSYTSLQTSVHKSSYSYAEQE